MENPIKEANAPRIKARIADLNDVYLDSLQVLFNPDARRVIIIANGGQGTSSGPCTPEDWQDVKSFAENLDIPCGISNRIA